jgi:copper resistance protein B
LALPVAAAAQDPHAGHGQNASPTKPAAPPQPPAEDHAAHTESDETPQEPIPTLTDADRAAAFPSGLDGHATHDRRITTFVLLDQLEWQGGGAGGVTLDGTAWVGGDRHRLWIRAEADSADGRVEHAQADLLYGRSVSRWWDLVVGMRQDVRPGPARTWAAVGVQGLAPYWFDVEATGYVGDGGRTHARVEVEYELLFTNRLILQPLVQAEFHSTRDPERGIGAGLSAIEAGLRLRYEVRRELAPYVGLTWTKKLFGTAEFARADRQETGAARIAIGLRTWF